MFNSTVGYLTYLETYRYMPCNGRWGLGELAWRTILLAMDSVVLLLVLMLR
jgi:hypothetical protein